jgi:archaellum component FlaC
LYKKSIQETKKGEKGIDVTSIKYGEVILPKNDKESYQEYLLRLEITYNKKISESFKNSFGNLTSFSKGIQASLRNTISIGEQLNKSLKMAQSYRMPKVEPTIPTSNIDFGDLSKQIAENKNRPFKELAERLDQLVEINSNSTQFMMEANKLQLRIAEEIKESNNSSTKLSKINILIALVVLVVSMLSFTFSIYTVHISNKTNNLNIERAINGLNTINETIKADKDNSAQVSKQLNALEYQLDSVSNRNAEIEKELRLLKSTINKPKKDQ